MVTFPSLSAMDSAWAPSISGIFLFWGLHSWIIKAGEGIFPIDWKKDHSKIIDKKYLLESPIFYGGLGCGCSELALGCHAATHQCSCDRWPLLRFYQFPFTQQLSHFRWTQTPHSVLCLREPAEGIEKTVLWCSLLLISFKENIWFNAAASLTMFPRILSSENSMRIAFLASNWTQFEGV